ncbi:Rapamycin-insensitive companion of mTOR [Nymphon striatum]|nr:Rapamycin-insensitive companion of mTOR [Nymphon striatum]
MMAAHSLRARNSRRRRSYKRQDIEEDEVKLDFTKDLGANLKEVLTNIVKSEVSNKEHKLNYLNAFVKLCQNCGPLKNNLFSYEEIICCLRTALIHDAKEVRTAGIRAFRYFLHDNESVDAFVNLQVDFLICRSLDIVLDNQLERVHALKLVRKMLSISPKKVTPALTRCIISLAIDEPPGQEKLVRACLCIIAELALVNTPLCAECGGLNSLVYKVIDTQQPWMNEAMIGVILYLLNTSSTRHYIRKHVNIVQLLAPFTDCYYRHSIDIGDSSIGDDREAKLQASKLALLSVLRSWSGLIWLCQSGSRSRFQSIVNALYLEYPDTQNGIMDLVFDLFRLPIPEWTKDFECALLSVDPSTSKASWGLYEGFIAEEGRDILPNQSKYRVNLVDNYIALLLFVFVNCGVLDALIEVATKGDKYIAVKATILLAELLNLTSCLLPSECSRHCQALPKLLNMSTSIDITKHNRHQASITVSRLAMVHKLKKREPVPSSLFLDQQIGFCSISSQINRKSSVTDLISRAKLETCIKTTDDIINQAIKDSCVLIRNEFCNWDWNLISNCIFKQVTDTFKRLEDVNHKLFVRKIVNFFKPSQRCFSDLSLKNEHSLQYSTAGCHLIEFLLDADEGEGAKIHDEWMKDIAENLNQVKHNNYSSDAVFSPNKLTRTLAQHYFLFFGKLSSSNKGCKILERSGIYQILLELIDNNCHSCYIKLIASCLDYTKPVLSRILLNKILTSSSEDSKLYGTNMLQVLLRAKLPDFHKWVIELLVTQLYDKNRHVCLSALKILDEACNEPLNLEALIQIRPSFLHLGDDGLLLLIRFLSLSSGFKFLNDANFIPHELQKWESGFLLKYVEIVESKLNQALTRHQTNENGMYGRHDSEKHLVGDVFLPPHLYGQLAQHSDGLDLLLQHTNYLHNLILTVQTMEIATDEKIFELKAAIWALAHIGTSVCGINFLNQQEVIPDIVKMAEECSVFSVRGTCYYAIGLLSSTSVGSNLLSQIGWQSKRQHRLEKWPVVMQRHHFDDLAEEYMRHYSTSSCDSHGDNEFILTSFENASVSRISESGLRTSSISEQTINHEQSRNRSISSCTSPTSNMDSFHKPHSSGSLCLRNSASKDETDYLSPTDGPGCNHRSHSNSIQSDNLSSGSCKVLHVRHGSATYVPAEIIVSGIGDEIDNTKERSRSLTENKSDKPSLEISKVGSDTRLQQMSKPAALSLNTNGWLRPVSSECTTLNPSDAAHHSHSTKNRSCSYADSTTSGISSCDSGHLQNTPVVIRKASTSSIVDRSPISPDMESLSVESNIEYLDKVRKRVKLRNTPNLIRHQSCVSPPVCLNSADGISMSSSVSLDNSIFNFTSTKNTVGQETIRNLQRSSGVDSSTSHQFDSFLSLPVKQRQSFDESFESSRGSTSSSTVSAEVNEESAKYMGVCLPIDAMMIFSVYDEVEVIDSLSEGLEQLEFPISRNDTGLSFHSLQNCIACHKIVRTEINEVEFNHNLESPSEEVVQLSGIHSGKKVSPASGALMATSETPVTSLTGSCTSNSSADLGTSSGIQGCSKLASIQQEIIRIIMNLSSSVAVKSAEQSLLNMKQKFPAVFQDVCLYSEICHLMASYKFRFSARKFLQEFFQDLNFNMLYEDAQKILNQKELQLQM